MVYSATCFKEISGVRIYVFVCVCVCVFMCLCMFMSVFVYVFVFLHSLMHARTCVHARD